MSDEEHAKRRDYLETFKNAVHGTQVVSVHWERLDQHVLHYIALDRMDVVLGTMLLERVARYLIGHRVIGINHQYRDNPPQFDCCMVAEWAGDATKQLSTTTTTTTTAGALMHGDHWMEERVGDAESQSRIAGRVRIPWTGNQNGNEAVDETHVSQR